MLVPFWLRCGSILAPLRVHFGTLLVPFGCLSGAILKQFWDYFGTNLGSIWDQCGEQLLNNVGIQGGSIGGVLGFGIHQGRVVNHQNHPMGFVIHQRGTSDPQNQANKQVGQAKFNRFANLSKF